MLIIARTEQQAFYGRFKGSGDSGDKQSPQLAPKPGDGQVQAGKEGRMLDSKTLKYYELFEWNRNLWSPLRALADSTQLLLRNPFNPLAHTLAGRTMAATAEMFERATRHYQKPAFGLHKTKVDNETVVVTERVVWEKPFCKLVHFSRELSPARAADPKILIVAPMSGHYATLLRGTVERFLPNHEVYITDWVDARLVPLSEGHFDLDDYIDYVLAMLRLLGPDAHVIGVCQPSVPVLAAVALMEAEDDPKRPCTMTLMGGPVDTRISPTAVGKIARDKGLDWFHRNLIMRVPFPNPGTGREVYPGFLQLSGFMSMNIDRHVNAHQDLFKHLVEGDGESAAKHKDFYDEYLAVMDLTAEFYLQTVDTVFVKQALPKGTMTHRGKPVDVTKITRTAMLTVEGEKDDITGYGQTEAAQQLCTGLASEMKEHYLQKDVGHYGVFNGSKFRKFIAPRVEEFIRKHSG
jgi:poly(3-hydroxybutyrate) depolymerase